MHRWSPLNERQLNLLTRIAEDVDPVTSDDSKLALTARALKDRGLITMPRSAGKWRAKVTDAGRFYLRHGHHPDRPDRVPRKRRSEAGDAEAQPSPAPTAQQPSAGEDIEARKPAARASRPSPEIPGPVLIKMVQKEGNFLRVPDPDDAERARYRRAFDAARQCAPPGYHLKYSGRDKGDFFLGLLRITGEDETEWNKIRLQRSRVLTDIEDVLTAVTADHSAFEISDDVLPRVLSLLRLLTEETERRHGDISVSKKRKQPRPLLTVHGRTYEVSFRERQKQVRHVPTQPGRKRTYEWQRVTPQFRSEPSGELELHIGPQRSYQGWKKEWGDTAKKPLEKQIGSVFRALKERAEEEERARLEWEAKQRRWQEEREREATERRRREAEERERAQREWETAVGVAKIKATDAARAKSFGTAFEQWRTAGEMRAFCAALSEAADCAENSFEAERLREWSVWGLAEADRLDPTKGDQRLGRQNFHAEPTGDELRPFLDGWRPDRPEKEKPVEPDPPKPDPAPWQGFSDVPRDQGWRYGPRGRAQWWRR